MPSCSAGLGCRVDATWAAKGRFRTRSGIWNQAALRQKGAGSAPRRFGVRDVARCADGATYYESQAPGFALDGGYRIADEIDAMSVRTRIDATYDRAAEAIRQAEALVITAGAGMGVDSGLPDFRGNEGFWRAYPPYADLGLSFEDLASPDGFYSEPDLAWGFYGHRLGLYRKTIPHEGFAILRRWAATKSMGHWVYTSNVDGQFQRAGFDPTRVTECHGAIDSMQCNAGCGADIFSADPYTVDVDPATFRARGVLPRCPKCRGLARPNIAMFSDLEWNPARTSAQTRRMSDWLKTLPNRRVVVVECGAGTAIPTVRRTSESLAESGMLVRINVRDPEVPSGGISLAVGALEGLRAIDARITDNGVIAG